MCEGYMDTIALHQAGFDNAVASLGTALTPDQAMLIARISKKVVITYDQDQAGRNAALRAIPILKDKGISVSVLEMTPYKDPDEFIKNLGADEYRKRIEAAKEAFFFEAETLHQSVEDNVDSKTGFDHEIARKIAFIDDPLERSNYINAVSKKYDIDKKLSKNNLYKKIGEVENVHKVLMEDLPRIIDLKNGFIISFTNCFSDIAVVQYNKEFTLIKKIIENTLEWDTAELISDKYVLFTAVGNGVCNTCLFDVEKLELVNTWDHDDRIFFLHAIGKNKFFEGNDKQFKLCELKEDNGEFIIPLS